MPISLSKPKTKPEAVQEATDDLVVVGSQLSPHAVLIDEVGALQLEALALSAKLAQGRQKLIDDIAANGKLLKKKLAELKASVADELSELDADGTFDVLGSSYKVEAGKKGTERWVEDMRLLHKLLDELDPKGDLFYSLASIGLGKIDDYLTPDQKELVLDSKRVAREIKIVRRS